MPTYRIINGWCHSCRTRHRATTPHDEQLVKPGGFHVGQYLDTDTGRTRWAVLARPSNVWYFPTRYGRRAAQALCSKLMKESLK